MFHRRALSAQWRASLEKAGISPEGIEAVGRLGITNFAALRRTDWGRLELLLGPGRAADIIRLERLKEQAEQGETPTPR